MFVLSHPTNRRRSSAQVCFFSSNHKPSFIRSERRKPKPCLRKPTRRREPRSSRPSALSATLSSKVDPTSKDPTFTDFSVANPVLPTVTRTQPPTRSLELPGQMIPFSNTWKTPRSTSRCVHESSTYLSQSPVERRGTLVGMMGRFYRASCYRWISR